MTEEKILTQHPEGKQGVHISKTKYEVMKQTITDLLSTQGDLTYSQLTSAAKQQLAGQFDGSIPWYLVTVKLDLEARGVIERVPKTEPQKLRLAS